MKIPMRDLGLNHFILYKGKEYRVLENKLTKTSSSIHVVDIRTREEDVIVGHVSHKMEIINPFN